MKWPTLRHPGLCRVVSFGVVIGTIVVLGGILCGLPVLSETRKAIGIIGLMAALLVLLVQNYPVLMALDLFLAGLSCAKTARTQYPLPPGCTQAQIEARIARYGEPCDPVPGVGAPQMLRYRFCAPWTIYSKGIEKVVLTYSVDCLDKETFQMLRAAAKVQSAKLTGRRRAKFLDRHQRAAKLNRVTVLIVFARQVEPSLARQLYSVVQKQCGDVLTDCVLSCVINWRQHSCVFYCLRVPYVGYDYAVVNRGIRLVKRLVFGGRLPLTQEHLVEPVQEGDDMDQSLWSFWKELHWELVGQKREWNRHFRNLPERTVLLEEDTLYLRLGERGIVRKVQWEPEKGEVVLDALDKWNYPRENLIGRRQREELHDILRPYFAAQGYRVSFGSSKAQD